MKKTVVLGVSSGIAAYKTVDLAKMLRKDGVDVFVVMTDSASKMVDPQEFEKASGNKVSAELFEKEFNYKDILKLRKVDHIDLADRADVIVIAPATANIIAKLAAGIADDFLTTMILASNSPIILSPSMNVHMWNNPLTQENITRLKKLGFIIIPPERGMLACGYEGPGRLPHLQVIRDEVVRHIAYSKSLIEKKILVTAGGTSEPIDAARVLTNKSSGKMGIAIAEECHLRGAKVLLLRAKSAVEPRYVMEQEVFETAEDLYILVKKYAKEYDIIFHTAAVSDFTPRQFSGKLSSKSDQTLQLEVGRKIINEIKILNPEMKVIGFKAVFSTQDKELVQKGKEKLKESGADVIVVNDISQSDRGFSVDTNEVVVVTKNGKTKSIPLADKRMVASKLVDYIYNDLLT